jgi:hypothetical protein
MNFLLALWYVNVMEHGKMVAVVVVVIVVMVVCPSNSHIYVQVTQLNISTTLTEGVSSWIYYNTDGFIADSSDYYQFYNSLSLSLPKVIVLDWHDSIVGAIVYVGISNEGSAPVSYTISTNGGLAFTTGTTGTTGAPTTGTTGSGTASSATTNSTTSISSFATTDFSGGCVSQCLAVCGEGAVAQCICDPFQVTCKPDNVASLGAVMWPFGYVTQIILFLFGGALWIDLV